MLPMILLFCITGLIGVLLFRTLTFSQPPLKPLPPADLPEIDAQAAARLGRALQFKTLSNPDPSQVDTEPFLAFQAFLAKSFPTIFATLDCERINDFSLLFTWPGSAPELAPVLLMAHQDVVPVAPGTEPEWTYPPFAGVIAEDYIWGRGALDVKGSLMGILEAVELLLGEGFQPCRTIYLAFGHDEEVGGAEGMAKIAALLKERGVYLEFVLDEGGAVLDNLPPNIPGPIALVGIAEKGFVNLELKIQSLGGHASMPGQDTAIGIICRAIARLETNPRPADLKFTQLTFRYLASRLSLTRRVLLANLWLFKPLVTRQLRSVPKLDAATRTTLAPTMIAGGIQENVLPSQVSANINSRILPGETVAEVINHVRQTIADPRIEIVPKPNQTDPSAVSDPTAASFNLLAQSIQQSLGDPALLVAPNLVVGATDSRYLSGLADNVYKFLLIRLATSDLRRIHGTDERLAVENYRQMIGFYYLLLKNVQNL